MTTRLLTERIGVAAAGCCLLAALTACGEESSQGGAGSAPETAAASESAEAGSGTQESASAEHAHEVSASGMLAEPASAQDAFTYDPVAAPVGAELSVTSAEADGSTTVEITATGMAPDRGYAVHAHTMPCGPTGDAAGPHFQNEEDPAEGTSVDPKYANPQNEVWLELATDASGGATDSTTVPFVFSERAPASIVVHAEPMTATAPGEAGGAGDRLACLNVPFE